MRGVGLFYVYIPATHAVHMITRYFSITSYYTIMHVHIMYNSTYTTAGLSTEWPLLCCTLLFEKSSGTVVLLLKDRPGFKMAAYT